MQAVFPDQPVWEVGFNGFVPAGAVPLYDCADQILPVAENRCCPSVPAPAYSYEEGDLGSHLQFEDCIAVGVKFLRWQGLSVNFSLMHYSNANLGDANDGINLRQLNIAPAGAPGRGAAHTCQREHYGVHCRLF